MPSNGEQKSHSKRGSNTMMPVLGTFSCFGFTARNQFVRKSREITQNKTNQETIKKIKSDSRLLKMKMFCGGSFR